MSTLRLTGTWLVLVACVFAAAAVPASAAGWQRLSSDDLPASTDVPSLLSGGRVVVAWNTLTGAVVATTFSSTPQLSVAGETAATVGVGSGTDLALISHPGSDLSAAFGSWQSQDPGDPRNGIAVVARVPDGSWAAPRIVPTGATSACGLAALLLSDGSMLFAANAATCAGVGIFHGAHLAGDADMVSYAPNDEATDLTMARDGRGRVWVAWYATFQGIVMRQLDGRTGRPIGNAVVAPDSIPPASIWETPGVSRFTLVCNPVAAGCRVVYKAHLGSRIVSFTPHDGAPHVLVNAVAGIALGAVAAAYRTDGRLWLAWIANPNFDRPSLRFTLSGSTGRPTAISRVPVPRAGVPTRLLLQPIAGGLLVLAGVPTTPAAELSDARVQLWADHVTKR